MLKRASISQLLLWRDLSAPKFMFTIFNVVTCYYYMNTVMNNNKNDEGDVEELRERLSLSKILKLPNAA
jgi:hypothetical protein